MHWHNENSTLIFWAAIAIIVVARSYFRNQSRMARYRMMEAMARQGQSIPPEMMADGRRSDWDHGWDRGWDRHFTIGHGIMLMCIGVAVSAFLWAMSGGGGFSMAKMSPTGCLWSARFPS